MEIIIDFKKMAKGLNLEDIGAASFGEKSCQCCGIGLRFGKDSKGYVWSYCPKCQKRISTVLMPRFQPTTKLLPHED